MQFYDLCYKNELPPWYSLRDLGPFRANFNISRQKYSIFFFLPGRIKGILVVVSDIVVKSLPALLGTSAPALKDTVNFGGDILPIRFCLSLAQLLQVCFLLMVKELVTSTVQPIFVFLFLRPAIQFLKIFIV